VHVREYLDDVARKLDVKWDWASARTGSDYKKARAPLEAWARKPV